MMTNEEIGHKIRELYKRWKKAVEALGYDADFEIFMKEIEEMVKDVEWEAGI